MMEVMVVIHSNIGHKYFTYTVYIRYIYLGDLQTLCVCAQYLLPNFCSKLINKQATAFNSAARIRRPLFDSFLFFSFLLLTTS